MPSRAARSAQRAAPAGRSARRKTLYERSMNVVWGVQTCGRAFLYVAAEAGRGPGMNDKPVYAACQPCAGIKMFIWNSPYAAAPFCVTTPRFACGGTVLTDLSYTVFRATRGKPHALENKAPLCRRRNPPTA